MVPSAQLSGVAPSRERGLKFNTKTAENPQGGRSFAGAWIEIRMGSNLFKCCGVAPSRERGLKSLDNGPGTVGILVAPSRERGLK